MHLTKKQIKVREDRIKNSVGGRTYYVLFIANVIAKSLRKSGQDVIVENLDKNADELTEYIIERR